MGQLMYPAVEAIVRHLHSSWEESGPTEHEGKDENAPELR